MQSLRHRAKLHYVYFSQQLMVKFYTGDFNFFMPSNTIHYIMQNPIRPLNAEKIAEAFFFYVFTIALPAFLFRISEFWIISDVCLLGGGL